jgi:hypothetical protein
MPPIALMDEQLRESGQHAEWPANQSPVMRGSVGLRITSTLTPTDNRVSPPPTGLGALGWAIWRPSESQSARVLGRS